MEYYSKESIQEEIEKAKDISFVYFTFHADKVLARIQVKTYSKDLSGTPIDSLDIICKDTKNRQNKTYEKIGITKEQSKNGFSQERTAKLLSDYFIEHNGIIVGYKNIFNDIKKINEGILSYGFEKIINCKFDTEKMLKECAEPAKKCNAVNDIKLAYTAYIRKVKRIEAAEQNKQSCSVEYAYYHETRLYNKISGVETKKKFLFCKTQIGLIYYDLIKQKWMMSIKERRETGLMIENFDTKDIEKQMLKKYHAKDFETLVNKLKQNWRERNQ